MKKILRHGSINKALDAVVTARLHGEASARRNLRLLFQPGTSGYRRICACIRIIDRLVPGFATKASNYIMRSRKLPLEAGQLTLENTGSGSTIFRNQNPHGDYVVKISRRTLGKPTDTLLKFAAQYRKNYKLLTAWYNNKFNLVPPSLFLIIHSGFLDTSCVACLQPYKHGEQQDLLRDFDDEQIVTMMRQDKQLCEQFLDFIRGTQQAIKSNGLCLDMLGKNNLMLLEYENIPQLVVVDYGIFDLDILARDMPEKMQLVERDIKRLEKLASLIA